MGFIRSDSSGADLSATAPQATNYVDMLKKLVAFSTNQTALTVTVNNGGTNYNTGDILELDGGTHPADLAGATCTFEVVDQVGGVIQAGGLRLRCSGSYSTPPGTTAVTTTKLTVAGTGSGCTVDMTYGNIGFTVDRRTQEIDTAVIGANVGTGYVTNDQIDVQGGDTRVGYDAPRATNAGRLQVPASVTTGQAFTILDRGIYHRNPGVDEVPTTVVTGSGDGAMTADLTFRDIANSTTDLEVIMSSANGTVGIRTFTNGTSVFNWEIAGLPTYAAANDWESQVNVSPGRYETADQGHYVVLRDIAFNYSLNVTDRRIVATFNIDNAVNVPLYLGLLNPTATAAEYPYAMMVNAPSSRRDHTVTSDAALFVGMNAAVRAAIGDTVGPCSIYTPGGAWVQVTNGYRSGTSILGDDDTTHIFPGGFHDPQTTAVPIEDRIVDSTQGNDWAALASIATASGASGAGPPTDTLLPTQGSGNDQSPLVEMICAGLQPQAYVYGELDGVKWVDRTLQVGVLNAEEYVQVGSELYIVFNNTKQTARQFWFAVRVS